MNILKRLYRKTEVMCEEQQHFLSLTSIHSAAASVLNGAMEENEGLIVSDQVEDVGNAKHKSDTSPKAFYRWLQSLRTKIISGGAIDRIPELQKALEHKHEQVFLTSDQALLRDALALHSFANKVSQHSFEPEALTNLISIHRAHLLDSASSSSDLRVYRAYFKLMLHLYYTFWKIQPIEVDLVSLTNPSTEILDLIQKWTGISGGPKFYQNGWYADFGGLKIPSHTQISNVEIRNEWSSILSAENVRKELNEALATIMTGNFHSQELWSSYYQFELTHISNFAEKDLGRLESIFLTRLQFPHFEYESTAQALSSFVTQAMAPHKYETIMSSAYEVMRNAKGIIESCKEKEESLDLNLKSLRNGSVSEKWSIWKPYVSWVSSHAQSRAKKDQKLINEDTAVSIFERALVDCGLPPSCVEEMYSNGGISQNREESDLARQAESKQQRTERQARELQELNANVSASAELWSLYLQFLCSVQASAATGVSVCLRACKAHPANGALRGQILRTFCFLGQDEEFVDFQFGMAMENDELQKDAGALSDLFLARIDMERERAAQKLVSEGKANNIQESFEILIHDPDAYMSVFAIMSFALESIGKIKSVDESLKLHKIVSQWCLQGGQGTAALMEPYWKAVVKAQKANHLALLFSSRYFQARTMYNQAKQLLKQGLTRRDIESSKKLELAEELLQVNRLSGTLQDIDWTLNKISQEREKIWSEYYASTYIEPVASEMAQSTAVDVEMNDETVATGSKRKASVSTNNQSRPILNSPDDKRGKVGETKNQRDREHSSVIVDNLPANANEDDLIALFKDCGDILEITGPQIVHPSDESTHNDTATALVEFTSRDAIPTVRSRQGKPVRSHLINIYLGYECTLYVTNFPSSLDSDQSMRALFSQLGRIFDIRWPSKKFSASRRFCYVVFCSTNEAHLAQKQLHGHQMEGSTLQVLISDPNRKKIRSDAFKDDCELFVSGLPKHVTETELEGLFGPSVEQVRILKHPDGRNRGIAYVDMETALDAQRVLIKADEIEGGGYRLSGKLIKVNKVDPKRINGPPSKNNLSAPMDIERRSKCLHIRGLPANAQEAVIQQILESVLGKGSVNQIEWQLGNQMNKGQATVEFINSTMAGRAALIASSSLQYDDDHPLELISLESRGAAGRRFGGTSATLSPPSSTKIVEEGEGSNGATPFGFVPRQAGNRAQRRARGFIRQNVHSDKSLMEVEEGGSTSKGQDTFRQMLDGKK